MSGLIKGLLTVFAAAALAAATILLVNFLLGTPVPAPWAALPGVLFGLGYGLQAGIYGIYPLEGIKGWVELVIDLTWSLPNTLFGFVIGNCIYPFFGDISKNQSKNSGWIVYLPPTGGGDFGKNVLQTLGTVNIGGAGQHERMHLLQARIFGIFYLVLFALNYVCTFLIQVLWTFTLGGLLWLFKIRSKPYFRPSSHSAVQGFFGWIYYATLFELWAYASGNP
ncbi:MAG: hypothetical protein P8X90_36880 [Desulfobacterales bacterium]